MPDLSLRPLALDRDNWRSRWLQIGDGRSLHRVATIAWRAPDEMIDGKGTAVCGAAGRMTMPGIMSRMSARRCPLCCDALGIPRGYGAPLNALEGDAADA